MRQDRETCCWRQQALDLSRRFSGEPVLSLTRDRSKENKDDVFGKKLIVFAETIGQHPEFLLDRDWLVKEMKSHGFELCNHDMRTWSSSVEFERGVRAWSSSVERAKRENISFLIHLLRGLTRVTRYNPSLILVTLSYPPLTIIPLRRYEYSLEHRYGSSSLICTCCFFK